MFTLLQGLASGLVSLLTFRLGLGVAEAPCYPTNSRVLSTWFPQHERARATGVYSVGQYFGLAFLSPLLFWIVAELGWRALFVIAGVAGLLFACGPAEALSRSARSPHASTRPSWPTSRPAAAWAIEARPRRSPGAISSDCSSIDRCWARPSASLPATPRWCSF